MDAEPNVTELLNRAVATLEPRVDLLVSGGAQRGRALRRRRRFAQFGSGAALTALIATVTVAVWPSASTAGHRGAASPGTSTVNRQPVGAPTATKQQRSTQQNADDSVAMTPQLLLQRTLDLLPGKATTHTYTGRSDAGWVGAEFVYDDGQGAAQVDVSMGFLQDGIHGAQPPCQVSDAGCRVLPDGSHVQVFRGPEYSQGHLPYNATEWSIDLVRADGVEVSLSEFNSTQEKDAPITRLEPPLSIADLTAIARSDELSPLVSGADADKAANLFVPDRTYLTPSAAEMLRRDAVLQARAERAAALRAEARREAAKEAKAARRAHQH